MMPSAMRVQKSYGAYKSDQRIRFTELLSVTSHLLSTDPLSRYAV